MQNNIVKITNAVYKMVEFFPDDPLKVTIKQQALSVLESVTRGSAAANTNIEVLLQYLGLARLQGWVNDMNYLILAKELEAVKTGLPTVSVKKIAVKKVVAPAQPNVVSTVKSQPQKPKKIEKVVPVQTATDFSDRQVKILSILKSRQKAQVGDLIKQLPKVTKRTIRRDLDDLLKRGKVVRVGQWNQVFYEVAR